jgi:hypothetical protein
LLKNYMLTVRFIMFRIEFKMKFRDNASGNPIP